MELLVKAVAQLEFLAREARATGHQGALQTLITAQNVVLRRMLVISKSNALQGLPPKRQRPKFKVVG